MVSALFKRRRLPLKSGALNFMSLASSTGLGTLRLTMVVPSVVLEQAIARTGDVLPRQSCRCCAVACGNGVEDALVLAAHLGGRQQVGGLHLPNAQLDLAHEQRVHAREARTGLAGDERAVEGDVVVGEVLVAGEQCAV